MWKQCVGVFLTVKFVTHFLFDITSCLGPSMLPTFNSSGDVVLIDLISVRQKKFQAGDVVVAYSLDQSASSGVMKRIIGMPGDRIYQNPFEGHHMITVPDDHVYLVGDNLNNSNDSRRYGPVPTSNVYGKVVWKISPFAEARSIQ
eukprot:Lithocolla_globosa_v1_NODE_11134_length_533_cov_2.514644.p1 type:complete len:145 gc:universal NODE_11134_length_533_cov_2.514644:491-57(-)